MVCLTLNIFTLVEVEEYATFDPQENICRFILKNLFENYAIWYSFTRLWSSIAIIHRIISDGVLALAKHSAGVSASCCSTIAYSYKLFILGVDLSEIAEEENAFRFNGN